MHSSSAISPSASCIQGLHFIGDTWLTFTLITNISLTSFGVAICISCYADFQTSWPEVWLSCSFSVCGSVCLDLCLDLNVKKQNTHTQKNKHLLRVSVSDHSCLNKVHFKDCWLLTPPQEKVIIGVAYDCVEKMVYWTEITSPSISKASIQGGEPISVIRSGSVTLILHSTGSPSFSAVFIKRRN